MNASLVLKYCGRHPAVPQLPWYEEMGVNKHPEIIMFEVVSTALIYDICTG